MSTSTTLGGVATLGERAAAPDEAPESSTGEPVETGGGAPDVPAARPAKRRPRRVRARTVDDWLSLGGSVLASFALLYVGYLHLFDLSGVVGFVVCWYFVFLAVYGTVVAIANPATSSWNAS